MITAELLEALLSSDTARRSQAEKHYESLTSLDRVQGLMNQLNHESPQIQLLTAVLLRRDILKVTDVNLLQKLVLPLLSSFEGRPQVGHCLAEVCAILSIIGGPSAQQVLQQILSTIEPSLRRGDIVSIRLLGNLADRAPVAFSKIAVPSIPALLPDSFSTAATVDAWTLVLVNSAVATTIQTPSLIKEVPDLDELAVDPNSAAASLAPSMGKVMSHFSLLDNEEVLRSCLGHLSHVAVTSPSLLAGNDQVLKSFIQTCLQLLERSGTSVQLSSIQTLASFLSVGDVKRRVINSQMASSIASKALPVCAQIMADAISDDFEEWATEPATLVEDAMEDDDDEAMFAESLFESLLQHLGGPALTVALPLVQQLLASDNWKHTRAGLAMLECGLAATPVSLGPFLPIMVQAATSLSASSNPRVQWQAIRLLGVLGEASDPSIRQTFWQTILEKLALALKSPCSKVSAMASLGIVSFCRGSGELQDLEDAAQYVQPFLKDLLESLVNGPLSSTATGTGSITASVRAMGATACLAESTGDAFCPYYGNIMPGLLASAQLPSVDLAGAAIEAATIVGQAVGLDLFRNDANQLLSWILPVLQQSSGTTNATLPLDQLLSACARIASVLGEEFAPHVDIVLPRLLQRANEPPDVSIVVCERSMLFSKTVYLPVNLNLFFGHLQQGDENDMDAMKQNLEVDDHTESMTVAVPGKGFTKVTINTSKIQEKAQATRAVYEHAKAMGAAFSPYVKSCLDVFLPLVVFQYSADVRSTAAQTLAAVFECACESGEKVGMQLPQQYLPMLVGAISKQIVEEDPSDMESMYALADSLSEVLYIVYGYRTTPLGNDILGEFTLKEARSSVEACMKAMVACLERRANITRVLSGALTGDDEKEEYFDMLREEQQLLKPLVDSVGYNLKFFCSDFVGIFESLVVPVLGPVLVSSGADTRALHSSLCLFDDCVEHCGSDAATRYGPKLLRGIIGVLDQGNDAPTDLLQPAIYGIAQLSRHAPSNLLAPHAQIIVHALLAITNCSKEEAADDICLVEGAVSALVSFTLLGPFADLKFVSRESLTARFLSHLPIQQDDDEAKICHEGLCTLIENGSVDLSANAIRITHIIGQILAGVEEGKEIATTETCERLTSILQTMGANLPQETMHQAFSTLGEDVQHAVSVAMQEFARSRVVTP
eukprot:scaffold374_cov124-Cylindrotheca_fusiformis.AAC.5